MLKQMFRASSLSMLLLQGATFALSANDTTTHTFADGAVINYGLTDTSKELSETPTIVSETSLTLPYIGQLKLIGKGNLAKEGTPPKYTLILDDKTDPAASFENSAQTPVWKSFKTTDKGSIALEINDNGESLKAKNFTLITDDSNKIAGEELNYSHDYKKVSDSEELFTNTAKLSIKNGRSEPHTQPAAPDEFVELTPNPFGQFKELLLDFSYISGADYNDYRKDLTATYSINGHGNFTLDGEIHPGRPFEKVPGAEKLEGYTISLSMPVIDMRVEGDAEKKALKEALAHNIQAYETLLEQYQNSYVESLIASIRKNKEELIDRHYKYFTELTKADIGSLQLVVKGASGDSEKAKITGLGELDLKIRNFIVKNDLTLMGDGSQTCVVSFPKPETSIKELTQFVRTNAWVYESILKDLGYWEVVNNFAEPEKLLTLLRQLSDDPTATGDAPMVITIKMDSKGINVGTISQERATQLVLSWALSMMPLPSPN